jgi:hypothetical protein
MLKFFFFLILIIATKTKSFCQAEIQIDSIYKNNDGYLYLNIGDCYIDSTEIFTTKIKIKNKGNMPLIISGCNTSDGGSNASWQKEPIRPNKFGIIEFRQDSNLRTGRQMKRQITIHSNAKLNPSYSFGLLFNMMIKSNK